MNYDEADDSARIMFDQMITISISRLTLQINESGEESSVRDAYRKRFGLL